MLETGNVRNEAQAEKQDSKGMEKTQLIAEWGVQGQPNMNFQHCVNFPQS